MARESSVGRDVALILAGAAVGAALGLLLAPRAGEQTREKVADWLRRRREELSKLREKTGQDREAATAGFKGGEEAVA